MAALHSHGNIMNMTPPRASQQMHHVFLVTEIIRPIFSQIFQDDKSSALALALTAKSFLDLGMECLWEELNDIRPLFRTLWQKKVLAPRITDSSYWVCLYENWIPSRD
jgi:hypothetical protein